MVVSMPSALAAATKSAIAASVGASVGASVAAGACVGRGPHAESTKAATVNRASTWTTNFFVLISLLNLLLKYSIRCTELFFLLYVMHLQCIKVDHNVRLNITSIETQVINE